jgi:hypothetical protein
MGGGELIGIGPHECVFSGKPPTITTPGAWKIALPDISIEIVMQI